MAISAEIRPDPMVARLRQQHIPPVAGPPANREMPPMVGKSRIIRFQVFPHPMQSGQLAVILIPVADVVALVIPPKAKLSPPAAPTRTGRYMGSFGIQYGLCEATPAFTSNSGLCRLVSSLIRLPGHGPEKYLQIQLWAPVFDGPEVRLDPLFDGRAAPVAVHLRPAGDAGLNLVLGHVEGDGLPELLHEVG